MYQSYFSYKIERKYPLRWFTWTAILGGIVLTTLFTIINVATNGYEPHFFYTTDPNGTMAEDRWFSQPPFSWAKTPATKCDSTAIPIGMKVFSDKLTLPYELSSVEKVATENNGVSTPSTRAPSLIYLSNILDDCEVNLIQVYMESVLDNNALTLSRVLWNPRVSSRIYCNISQDGSTTRLELLASYDPTVDSPVIPVNRSTDPSLWWGLSLLKWYAIDASQVWRKTVESETQERKPAKGYVSFEYSNTTKDVGHRDFSNTTKDVEHRDFFKSTMFVWGKEGQTVANSSTVGGWMDGKMPYSSAATAFDQYAKSFYSFILADLGLNTSTLATKATALELYSKDFKDGHQTGSLKGYMTPESYKASEALSVRPSTLYAQYFCQTPKRKPPGSLFVAVFMADLVFLSAAWTLFNWVATAWVDRYDENSMHCAGCAAVAAPGVHELQMLKPPSDADVPLLGPGHAENAGR